MSVGYSFDFAQYNYSFDQETGEITMQKKDKATIKTAKETLAGLESCQKNILAHWKEGTIAPANVRRLQVFSHELEAYIEQSIHKKHPYLGGIIVLFQNTFFGTTLSSLMKLEKKFTELSEKVAKYEDTSLEPRRKLLTKLMAAKKDVAPLVGKLIFLQPNLDWLSEFADANPSNSLVKQLFGALGKMKIPPAKQTDIENIFRRYKTLKALKYEEHGLNSAQMLKTSYVKKTTNQLARSLIYDSATQEVYILSKRKVKILHEEGTSKKVTSAIRLALTGPAEIAAQSVTLGEPSKRDLKDTRLEMKYHMELKNSPGIWPIYFWCDYTKVAAGKKIQKVTALGKKAGGDLWHKYKKLTNNEAIEVGHQLIQGLHAMHEKDLVHGDLKLLNALMKRENGRILAGLIDFGFTFNVKKEAPTFIFDKGYYGSIGFTPPEVFGKRPFRGDYKKTDVWALGYMLYQLRFKAHPPWQKLLDRCYESKATVTRIETQEMDALVTKVIEEPLSKLNQEKGPLSKDQQFERLIYNMMRHNPKERYSMAQALAEIEKLLSST
jgi:hypothetical protein